MVRTTSSRGGGLNFFILQVNAILCFLQPIVPQEDSRQHSGTRCSGCPPAPVVTLSDNKFNVLERFYSRPRQHESRSILEKGRVL